MAGSSRGPRIAGIAVDNLELHPYHGTLRRSPRGVQSFYNIIYMEDVMAEVLLKDITKIYEGDVLAVDKVNIEIKDQGICCSRRSIRVR
jgi:hypothetical protein